MTAIESIMEQLRVEFPEAQVNLDENKLLIRFMKTHISTAKINKVEEILFFRGKLISNSKELITVENGTLFVNLTNWGVFYQVYKYLKKIGISANDADIDEDVSFTISNYLTASQLDDIQDIVNEELGINLVNHDSIRVFGRNSQHTMYIRCHKRGNG